LLRRCLNFIERYKFDINLTEVAKQHALWLKRTEMLSYDLSESIEQFSKILEIETARYNETKKRSAVLISTLLEEKKMPNVNELITLYESQGIQPEFLQQAAKEKSIELQIPAEFYQQLTAKHEKEKKPEEMTFDGKLHDVAATKIIYHEKPSILDFEAKVLKLLDNGKIAILDKTAFYPESGGQEADRGTIKGIQVIDVQKQNSQILHFLESPIKTKTGEKVSCEIDAKRRKQLMQHHSATHIVNYASRKVLGQHVWQHGAHKSEKESRLDITHFANLTKQELGEIERLANEIIKKAIPIKTEIMQRQEAEKRFGFRIYQGGAVPESELRMVIIDNLDTEACGGIHCSNTSELEQIKIISSERIADGVTRLTFAAGNAASQLEQEKGILLEQAAMALVCIKEELPDAAEQLFIAWKKARKLLRKQKQGKQITEQELRQLELKPSAIAGITASDPEILAETLTIFRTQPENLPRTLARFKVELEEMKKELAKKK